MRAAPCFLSGLRSTSLVQASRSATQPEEMSENEPLHLENGRPNSGFGSLRIQPDLYLEEALFQDPPSHATHAIPAFMTTGFGRLVLHNLQLWRGQAAASALSGARHSVVSSLSSTGLRVRLGFPRTMFSGRPSGEGYQHFERGPGGGGDSSRSRLQAIHLLHPSTLLSNSCCDSHWWLPHRPPWR